jgi:hypothetical protein
LEGHKKQFYRPVFLKSRWSFGQFIGHQNIRYFSYGRHALVEGLLSIGVKKGDKIIVPAYICRELLSAIHTLGALSCYYDVDRTLQPMLSPESLPASSAIIAVNFFGFPADLQPFESYCRRTGAVLIEDNAHGLFSRDETGRVLGSRGDIGIFSFRKTILLPDGAAMVLNSQKAAFSVRPQLDYANRSVPPEIILKNFLLKSASLGGLRLLQLLIAIKRSVRNLKTGHKIPVSLKEAELVLPGNSAPHKKLHFIMSRLDVDHEIYRRQMLYDLVDNELKQAGFQPIFPSLPLNVVPYGYPFYSSKDRIERAKKVLKRIDLECHPWPELPDAVFPNSPEHYKTIWMVGFSW